MRHKIFGDDADCFRPERWLEAEPERLKEMENIVDLVFGSGRWLCLGKTMVLMELRKVFVEVSARGVMVLCAVELRANMSGS